MPPQYVKAYVRRQKERCGGRRGDLRGGEPAGDALRAVKGEAQQAALVLHRVHDLLLRQRTMLINALRGHLAEFGVIAPQGPRHVAQLAAAVRDEDEGRVPEPARRVLLVLVEQLEELVERLAALGRELLARRRASPTSRRLATITAGGNDPVPQGSDRLSRRSIAPASGR